MWVCRLHYGLRYYSPTLGRFINRDPIEEQGGLSLYAFCLNNPINLWDFLGQDPPGEYLTEETPFWAGRDATHIGVIAGYETKQVVVQLPPFHVTASRDTSDLDLQYSAAKASYNNWESAYVDGFGQGFWATFNGLQADELRQQQYQAEVSLQELADQIDAAKTGAGSELTATASTPVVTATSTVPASTANSAQNSGGFSVRGAVDVTNSAAGLTGAIATDSARELQAAGRFAMNGRIYRVGFYGNQAARYSAAEVAAAKSTQATIATASRVIRVGGAAAGAVLSTLEVYAGRASNQSIARGVVGAIGTGSAFIPIVGPFVSVGISVANAAGSFDPLYKKFDNTPRFGKKIHGAGGSW